MIQQPNKDNTTTPPKGNDTNTLLADVFDWEFFKNYVNTYDPIKDGLKNQRIIMNDMMYGIGLSMNKEKYEMFSGYQQFKKFLKSIF